MRRKRKSKKKPKPIKPRNYLVPLMRRLKPGPHKDKRDEDQWKEWEDEHGE